jgi:putative colanic acid biosynthesis acetyltransferase WcaF
MDLAHYQKPALLGDRGRGWKIAWYLCSLVLFQSGLVLPSALRAAVLRAFGARVGKGLVMRAHITVKYPWFLEIGDHVWIGEGVWIDNHCEVRLGGDVCVSQGAYLFTGNHDYAAPSFAFFCRPIAVEDGVWIGARALVCPGAHLRAGVVLAAGSVFHARSEPGMVYAGNPAIAVKPRTRCSSDL